MEELSTHDKYSQVLTITHKYLRIHQTKPCQHWYLDLWVLVLMSFLISKPIKIYKLPGLMACLTPGLQDTDRTQD